MSGSLHHPDHADKLWRVELFGRLSLAGKDRVITRFPAGKARGLFARLACYLHRQHPREELIELLWPDSDPAAARLRLRVAINSLRSQLEPAGIQRGSVLIAEDDALRLNPDAVEVDADRFERLLRAAHGCDDAAQRFDLLSLAVNLYTGELLPGIYDDWLLVERERLSEACLGALRSLVEHEEAAGDLQPALEHARRAVAMASDSEECHEDLIRLLALAGRKEEARTQFRRASRILRERVGAAPSPELRQLVETEPVHRRGAGTAAAVAARSDAPARERQAPPVTRAPCRLPLTLTRFFGRETEIEELERLLAAGARPGAALSTARLVTLTGTGGVGKTRVCIEAARRLAHRYPGGVCFAPLAAISEAAAIPEAILQALGHQVQSATAAARQVAAAYLASGDQDPALLILDNVEHLLHAPRAGAHAADRGIGDGVGGLLAALLGDVPHLTILATSREALGVPGEREYPLRVLATPMRGGAPERLLEFPSVLLFTDRAQAVRPDFRLTERNVEAVAALCERLEGLPLAIELAAAWARVLTPQQILARTKSRFELLASRGADVDDRHRSLQASLEWSYLLLAPAQQAVLARLAVFHGGWTVEAAEAVCADRRAQPEEASIEALAPAAVYSSEVLDLLAQLAASSLIHAEETPDGMRYRMLETVREFAGSQLLEADWEVWRRRHADWCLREARRGHDTDTTGWLERMESERANMRAAIEWCAQPESAPGAAQSAAVAAARHAPGVRLADALFRFWYIRGYLREGRLLVDMLRERVARDGAPSDLATLCNLSANLAEAQGEATVAATLLHQAIALYRAIGDSDGTAAALHNLALAEKRLGDYKRATELCVEALAVNRERGAYARAAGNLTLLGSLSQEQGDYAAARGFYERAVEIQRAHNDPDGEARTLSNLANVLDLQGDYELARALHQQALDVYCKMGNRAEQARVVSNIAGLALRERDLTRAAELYREARTIRADIGDRRGEAEDASNLAWVLNEQGELIPALRLLAEAAEQMRAIGYPRGEATALNKLGCIHQQLGAHADARRCQESALRMRVAANNRSGAVYSLWDLASLAFAEGEPDRAAQLAGAAHALQHAIGMVLPPAETETYARAIAAARAALGDREFDAHWSTGAALSMEQACEYALRAGAHET